MQHLLGHDLGIHPVLDVILGSPATVGAGLHALVQNSGADELMIKTDVYDHADRRRCLELVADLATAS